MRRFAVIIVLCCAFVEAQAIVPLEIRATIQLPNTALWDIQHCADDSTFGWAYVVGDTIRWVERLGDSVQSYTVPLDIYTPYGNEGPYHAGLKLLHLASQGDHLSALLESNMIDWAGYASDFNGYTFFCLFDLHNQQLTRFSVISGSSSISYGANNYWTSNRTIIDLKVWPPMPATSTTLICSQISLGEGYRQGNHWISETTGSVFYADLDTSQFSLRNVAEGIRVVPFADFTRPFFAISGYYRFEDSNHYNGHSEGTSRSWRAACDVTSGVIPVDITCLRSDVRCPNQFQLPQHDANDTNRMVTEGAYAISATSFDTLWHNPAIAGSLHTMRMEGIEDERILAFNSQTRCFGIFDGSTGAFLDNTTSIEGTITYVIKQPGHADEIVTVDATHLVRVYGSQLPVVEHLTCRFIPASNEIHLRWSAIAGAVRYYVYSANSPDGTSEPVAEVHGTSVCALPASANREFFRVVAEFE
jgi:hypothetical protein